MKSSVYCLVLLEYTLNVVEICGTYVSEVLFLLTFILAEFHAEYITSSLGIELLLIGQFLDPGRHSDCDVTAFVCVMMPNDLC